MPHHKSCKKRLKTSARDRLLNNALKTNFRRAIKSVRNQLEANEEVDLGSAYAEIDKAYRRGLIHRNRAARIKSRLAKAAAKKVENKS